MQFLVNVSLYRFKLPGMLTAEVIKYSIYIQNFRKNALLRMGIGK